MKAMVLYEPGDMRVENRAVPLDLKRDEVLIEVKAAGVCGSDLARTLETGMYTMPAVPGHEFCGQVVRTGRGVSKFKTGDRVVVAPILPCFHCESCMQGNYGQCDHYDYIGSRRDGAFAEFVAAPERNVLKLPNRVDYLEGGAVEPAAVTLHGMQRIAVSPGETVVVLGCGTLGLFAIQFAKILGAGRVVAVDIADAKFEYAKKAGADLVIDSKKCDPVKQMQDLLIAPDVVVETAGSNITQEQSIRMVKKHGRILFLGSAHKDVVLPPKTFEYIIRNEIRTTGSWNSYSAPFPGREWTAVLQYLDSGRLNISSFISHVISLEELPDTIRKMANREIEYNKVVVKMGN